MSFNNLLMGGAINLFLPLFYFLFERVFLLK